MSAGDALALQRGAVAVRGVPGIARRLREIASVRYLAPVALFVAWSICNPYFEIGSSSLIYSARAIADLDPAGVGRDIMFRFDGQSGFTLFTVLFRALTSAVGPSAATFVVALASLLAGFSGAMVLASSIGPGRTRVLAVIFAAALPAFYGGFKIFSYAEVAATPRPFAEALVLCGLAAIVRGRFALAALAVGAAVLLHPIMALPGVGVLFVSLVMVDRRWWLAVPLVGGMGALVVILHPAVAAWLGTPMDPAWKAILLEHSPQLFPSHWPEGWIGRAAARIATLIVAARLTSGPVRKLFLATIVVGLGGLAFAFIAERLPFAVGLQVQSWRMMWIVFSVGTAGAAICVVELWRRGGMAHVVLALLALAWVYADHDQAGALFALSALGLIFVAEAEHVALSPKQIKLVLAAAGVLLLVGLVGSELSIARAIGDASADQAGEARAALALDWDYTPLAVLAAAYVARRVRPRRFVLIVLIASGLLGLGLTWDRRSRETRYFDAGLGAPDLVRIVGVTPGEVYWIGGVRESWSWLARPQWLSAIQGAGLVFSRELAMVYQARIDRAEAAGLVEAPANLSSATASDSHGGTFAGVSDFCAAADAPAWIIAPLQSGEALPATRDAVAWTAPVAHLQTQQLGGELSWRTRLRYALIPCRR